MEMNALIWETPLMLYVDNFGVEVASLFRMAGKRTRRQWRDFAFSWKTPPMYDELLGSNDSARIHSGPRRNHWPGNDFDY